MKPDVIVCWPRNCDFPLWRQFIHDNRGRFNEIIVAFTESNHGPDYRQFLREAMFPDAVQFVDIQPTPSGEDWRNVAVNAALRQCYNAEWVWFTEQDFIPGNGFFDVVDDLSTFHDAIGVKYESRLHPCSLFIRRVVLNQTHLNFGIVPDVSDHFSLIQRDIEQLKISLGIIDPIRWEHLNGLSHNFSLVEQGQQPNHQVKRFNLYLLQSLEVSVPQSPEWIQYAVDYLKTVKSEFSQRL